MLQHLKLVVIMNLKDTHVLRCAYLLDFVSLISQHTAYLLFFIQAVISLPLLIIFCFSNYYLVLFVSCFSYLSYAHHVHVPKKVKKVVYHLYLINDSARLTQLLPFLLLPFFPLILLFLFLFFCGILPK